MNIQTQCFDSEQNVQDSDVMISSNSALHQTEIIIKKVFVGCQNVKKIPFAGAAPLQKLILLMSEEDILGCQMWIDLGRDALPM